MSIAISKKILGILTSSSTEKSSAIGVVRDKNAMHVKPPSILVKTSNPKSKPSEVTAVLNIPSSNMCEPVPKNIAMKTKVSNPKLNGIMKNFK
jgi:hypothetical protein